jgi:signal transduction histidine kinase
MQEIFDDIQNELLEVKESNNSHSNTDNFNGQFDPSKKKLADLFNKAPAAIAILKGPNLIFEYTNEYFQSAVGGRNIIGKPIKDALPELKSQGFFTLLNKVYSTGREYQGEEVPFLLRMEGSETLATQWLNFVFQPTVDAEGNVNGIWINAVDITDLITVRDRLYDLNRELEERVKTRTEELEHANRELESFAYSVSHDLRAPLRHIDGYTKLLMSELNNNVSETSQKYLNIISNSISKMGSLIDKLLSFSRMTRTPMVSIPVNLEAVVNEVMSEMQQDIAGRNIEIKVGTLPSVYGDPLLLKTVLTNLISNSIKFTRNNPDTKIELDLLEENEKEYTFYIKDNGAGFDMKYAHKLFGVFQRLHSERQFEGTGIGLANVQKIITRHGGKIRAEGKINRGAAFYFTLPKIKDK